MVSLSLADIVRATGGRTTVDAPALRVTGVSTDSRNTAPGDLFVCLTGPRFDGHEYAGEALRAGAVALLVQHPVAEAAAAVTVPDTLRALGALGQTVRRQNPGLHLVAITGSNGKTSTKDFTAAVLDEAMPTVASYSSFNNAIGVPHTLLRIGPSTRAAVVELGSNAPGEIAQLADLARPTVAVITNVGPAHLAGLGSSRGVLEEKASLLDHLQGDRVAILNRDDPVFDELAERAPGPVLGFGFSKAADLRAREVRTSAEGVCFELDGSPGVQLRLLGRHAVSNALAALACARALGLDPSRAARALDRVGPAPGRLQLRVCADVTLLDDSYNSNPASLERALQVLAELPLPGRRVFVVGDMAELGREATRWHAQAGRWLGAASPAVLLAVGRHAATVVAAAREVGMDPDRCHTRADAVQAQGLLACLLAPGDLVFLKASRSVGLDSLARHLAHAPAGAP